MKKLLLPLLLLMSMMAMGKEPYYIVNGLPGVAKKDLPPAEQIGSRKELSPEEAVYIYGEKASGGAVLIKTRVVLQQEKERKKAVRRENEERKAAEAELAQTKEASDESQDSVSPREDKSFYLWLLLAMLPLIVKLIQLAKKAMVKVGLLKAKIYSPGPFDPEGVRFNVSGQFVFRMLIVYFVVGLIAQLYMIVTMWLVMHGFARIVPMALIAVAVFFAYFCYLRLQIGKSYLVIDEQGIHGLIAKYSGVLTRPQFEEINIAWKQVESARYFRNKEGSNALEYLLFYDATSPGEPFITLNMAFFPVSKIIDGINYFYTGYSHKSVSDNPLIAPL
ncbi:MAG: hypothetical protein J6M55_05675 [Paludibacteraceae bacterium]|nr:hypothetical protein [Paludibacteraceae bacterium]